jgi:hypothetical protein
MVTWHCFFWPRAECVAEEACSPPGSWEATGEIRMGQNPNNPSRAHIGTNSFLGGGGAVFAR